MSVPIVIPTHNSLLGQLVKVDNHDQLNQRPKSSYNNRQSNVENGVTENKKLKRSKSETTVVCGAKKLKRTKSTASIESVTNTKKLETMSAQRNYIFRSVARAVKLKEIERLEHKLFLEKFFPKRKKIKTHGINETLIKTHQPKVSPRFTKDMTRYLELVSIENIH